MEIMPLLRESTATILRSHPDVGDSGDLGLDATALARDEAVVAGGREGREGRRQEGHHAPLPHGGGGTELASSLALFV